jgi:hypothetical protein
MDEIYEMLQKKLKTMRDEQTNIVSFDYHEVSQMYQMVCLMKQVKDIVNWGDKGYV